MGSLSHKRFQVVLMVVLIFFYSIIPSAYGSNDITQLQKLDQLSEEVYNLTKSQQYDAAKDKLEQLSETFASTYSENKMDIESLEIFTRTIVNGKRAFSTVAIDEDRLLWHALQIRLMIDSFSHRYQPLWKNYYSTYAEQINRLLMFASRQDAQSYNQELEKNHQLYLTLRPAILVNQSVQTIEMFDSLYQFLGTKESKTSASWEEITGGLEQLKQAVQQVFLGADKDTAAMNMAGGSPYVIITGIAAIVITTLTYVAWRKYRGEKGVHTLRLINEQTKGQSPRH